MGEQNYVKELKHLEGYWFVSMVSSVRLIEGTIKFLFHFNKLREDYDFQSPPFLNQNIVPGEFEIFLPTEFLLLLKMGRLVKDGDVIQKLFGSKQFIYNIDLEVEFNPVESLNDIDRIVGTSKIHSDVNTAYLKSSMFNVSAQREKEFLICPSNELIRHFFINGKSSAKDILDQSFSIKSEIKELWSRSDEQGEHLYLKTVRNFLPKEFLNLAQLCTDNDFLKLYNYVRAKLYYSFNSKINTTLSAYFISSMRSIRVLAKPIEYNGLHGLFVYQILSSSTYYEFDSLRFISEIDGRSGPNRNDPNLEKKTNKKKTSKDIPNISGGKVAPLAASIDIQIEGENYQNLPFMLRDERGDQKAVYKTKIDIQTLKEVSLSDQLGHHGDSTDRGGLVPNQSSYDMSNNQMTELRDILTRLGFDLDVIINYRIAYRDEENLSKRPESGCFNTIPIENIPYTKMEFACLHKKKGYWQDRRGIVIVEFCEQNKNCYLVEIEKRYMKSSHERFNMLLFYKSNYSMITDDEIVSLLKLCREIKGIWKKAELRLKNLGLKAISTKHTEYTFERIKSFVENSILT